MTESAASALDRLELRIERLGITVRFTYAFHAREVRFERDTGNGFERIFPETFSFHADRHDPAELYLQLDDLSRKPALLAPRANRRDAQILSARLTLGIPRYLESVLLRMEGEGRVSDDVLTRSYEDIALLARVSLRFVRDRVEEDGMGMRTAIAHFRKIVLRCLQSLVRRRVEPSYLEAYIAGTVDPVDPSDDLSEAGFFYTMEGGNAESMNRCLVRLTERAFFGWLEDVCLDEENQLFEFEGTPFDSRETEVRRVIGADGAATIERGRDLTAFLRRRGNRDALRLLEKLEAWFLRQYDVYHAAVVIHHADNLRNDTDDADRVLSRHSARNYGLAIGLLIAPFFVASVGYERAPLLFDFVCSAEMIVADAAVLWFFLYRFCWKRNLTFFHASVPRIGAGIIVGYLPIFFIDEVWYLAQEAWVTIGMVSLLLGFATLLYLYVEVQRKLADSTLAFARARQIFLLGVLEALGIGILLTGLIGGLMAERNWQQGGAALPLEERSETLPAFVGQIPMILGIGPFYAVPSAVLLMTFMSFFIGTFLQLMWEDLPITEPL